MTLISLLLSQIAFAAAPVFTYEPVEGADPTACTAKQVQDLPDWDVACGTKNFGAHVVVHELPHGSDTSEEILYWVTERNGPPHKPRTFHSTSAIFRLKGKTSLSGFSISQGIENDQASLVLGWAAE